MGRWTGRAFTHETTERRPVVPRSRGRTSAGTVSRLLRVDVSSDRPASSRGLKLSGCLLFPSRGRSYVALSAITLYPLVLGVQQDTYLDQGFPGFTSMEDLVVVRAARPVPILRV